MTTPQYGNLPAQFLTPPATNFTIGNTTTGKVLVDSIYPATAATSTAPELFGGCTVFDLLATSSDATARDVFIYLGTMMTTQNAGTTGVMTTTSSTIPRTTGSFITDGWLVGDQVMTFAPAGTAPNAAVDGIVGIITSVAALTLTVTGTPFAALTLAAGTRIVKVSTRGRTTVPISAGTNGTTKSQTLIGAATDGSLLTTEIKLSTTSMLIAAMQATISALPAVVSIQPTIALY